MDDLCSQFAYAGAPKRQKRGVPLAASPASVPAGASLAAAPAGASMALAPAGASMAPAPQAAVRPIASVCAATSASRLAEFALISSYRAKSKASVDAFHAFLVSLPQTASDPAHGRFWALVACLLSVQCRDVVALEVTRGLMNRCSGQGAAGIAALSTDELEAAVHRCNFFKTKAKNVRAAAERAIANGGQVPSSYEGLLALEGVGPKIAHLMRSVAFGESDAGIVVDTHVLRVATLLGWVELPMYPPCTLYPSPLSRASTYHDVITPYRDAIA